jgi:hypothetical protein
VDLCGQLVNRPLALPKDIDQLRPPAVPQRLGSFYEGIEERILFLLVAYSHLLFKSSLDKSTVRGFLFKYLLE